MLVEMVGHHQTLVDLTMSMEVAQKLVVTIFVDLLSFEDLERDKIPQLASVRRMRNPHCINWRSLIIIVQVQGKFTNV